MKIYFAGSIRGGRDNKEIYSKIIELLQNYGEVLTEHIGDPKLTVDGENNLEDKYIFERDVAWVKEAEVFVADVTTPSLGVGYEISLAESLNKKILCLFREENGKRVSAMVSGNDNLTTKTYQNISELPEIFEEFFK